MPRLKESQEQKQDILFKALIAKNMTLCGIKYNNDLAIKMHMGRKALGYKLEDPDKFTRKELRRLFLLLKFTEEEKGKVI